MPSEQQRVADSNDHPFERRRSNTWLWSLLAVLVSLTMHATFWFSALWIGPTVPNNSFVIAFDIQEHATLTGLGLSEAPKPEPEPEMVGPHELIGPPSPPPPPELEDPPKSSHKRAVVLKRRRPKNKVRYKNDEKDSKKIENKVDQKERAQAADSQTSIDEKHPKATHMGGIPFKPRHIPSVHTIAPGNAVVSAMVDMRRIRSSPYRTEIQKLLKSYPDYHRVMGTRGQDPVETYNRFYVATANPRIISQTLLLGEVRQPEQLHTEMDRIAGEPLTWKTDRGGLEVSVPKAVWWARRGDDPRVFVIPKRGVVALARPELLDWFARRRRAGSFFPAMPTPITTPQGVLPAGLVAEVRLKAGGQPIAVTPTQLPAPIGVSVALHDSQQPLIRVVLSFVSVEDADRFAQRWPKAQHEVMNLMFIRMGPYRNLIGRIQSMRDGDKVVYLEVRGTPKEMRSLLALLTHAIKTNTHYHHPRPGERAAPESETSSKAETSGGGLWDDPEPKPKETPNPSSLWGKPTQQPDKSQQATQEETPKLKNVGDTLTRGLSNLRKTIDTLPTKPKPIPKETHRKDLPDPHVPGQSRGLFEETPHAIEAADKRSTRPAEEALPAEEAAPRESHGEGSSSSDIPFGEERAPDREDHQR